MGDAVATRPNHKKRCQLNAHKNSGRSASAVKKFSGLQMKILKKLFTVEVHPHGMDFGALAFVRLYVWLVLVKVVRN